ncbi:MAG: putative toxin-antitoxin system toxin component, PIN family [Rhodanobacteraceae bacterium]
MRLVADTNILISGLLWHGAPRQLVDAAQAGAIQFVTSQLLLDELGRVATRAKFQRRLATLEMTAAELLAAYAEKAACVVPAAISPTILRDPDDDAVLAAALGGHAQMIVSGDGDLLDLRQFSRIPIMTVNAALDVIR